MSSCGIMRICWIGVIENRIKNVSAPVTLKTSTRTRTICVSQSQATRSITPNKPYIEEEPCF